MTRAEQVAWQSATVVHLTRLIGVVWACLLVGLSRATHHRVLNPQPRRPPTEASASCGTRRDGAGSDHYAPHERGVCRDERAPGVGKGTR